METDDPMLFASVGADRMKVTFVSTPISRFVAVATVSGIARF